MTRTMDMLLAAEKRLAGFAKSVIDKGDEFIPMIEMFDGETFQVMLLMDLMKPEMRPYKRQILMNILAGHNAISYMMATEAWSLDMTGKAFAEMPLDEEGMPILQRPIREDDRRKSILALNGENIEGELVFASYTIDETKGKRNLPAEPDVRQSFESGQNQGRLQGDHFGLLKRRMQ